MAIRYYEEAPQISIDAEGISGVVRSGDYVSRWRCSRALWRRFLETGIRQLNEFECEERKLARGKILPLKSVVERH